jgi:hypothetical protein
MAAVISLLLTLRDSVSARAALQFEMLALRHQLHVLERWRARRVIRKYSIRSEIGWEFGYVLRHNSIGARDLPLGRCPFLALSVHQRAAKGSKGRHKAKGENRRNLRGMRRDPAASSKPPQRAANASFSAC